MSSQLYRGMAAASVSYLIWGILPIYWKTLDHVPAYEILGHRMAWSLPFVVLFLFLSGQKNALLQLRSRRSLSISAGSSGFLHGDLHTMALLAGTGLITTVPLLLLGYAAQKIPMFWLGILQYTAPNLNLMIGVLVYGEEFPSSRLIGFLLVWSALAVLMAEGIVQKARQQRNIAVGTN